MQLSPPYNTKKQHKLTFRPTIVEEREAFYVQDVYMSCVPANVEFVKVTDALVEYTTTGVGSRAGEMVGVLSATRVS